MDKSLLKKAALQSVTLMMTVIMFSYGLKNQQAITIMASSVFNEAVMNMGAESNPKAAVISLDHDQKGQAVQTVDLTSNIPITDVESLKNRIDNKILEQLGDNFLVIKKPQGSKVSLQLEDLYISHSIQLNFSGLSEGNLPDHMVLRVRGNDLFTELPTYHEIVTMETDKEKGTLEEVITRDYGKDLCHGITITTQKDSATDMYQARVLLELDSVYAYIVYEDASYYYIDLRRPSQVYDKILVIDAGHGGKDAGAISRYDDFYEKDINLDIVLQLKTLLDKEGIKVYYTRTSDDTVFLRPRATLANSVDCDYFISIHCNSNEVTYPNGTEVLYYDTDFKGVRSYELASLFSEEIANNITLVNKGTVRKQLDDLFIMNKSEVPTILIEVGYLSNRNDMAYLSKPENRQAVAQGIYKSIIKAYKELPVIEEH